MSRSSEKLILISKSLWSFSITLAGQTSGIFPDTQASRICNEISARLSPWIEKLNRFMRKWDLLAVLSATEGLQVEFCGHSQEARNSIRRGRLPGCLKWQTHLSVYVDIIYLTELWSTMFQDLAICHWLNFIIHSQFKLVWNAWPSMRLHNSSTNYG